MNLLSAWKNLGSYTGVFTVPLATPIGLLLGVKGGYVMVV